MIVVRLYGRGLCDGPITHTEESYKVCCDREASIMRRPWPTRGCCYTREKITADLNVYLSNNWGRERSVGIATRYGLDGPGIESRWGQDFPHRPDQPWGPPSLLYNGYRVFHGGEAAEAWH